ncbi:MAG TPA: CDGSH iron-sulfur domain-containing protein [Desulfitobacteriaceae bacterium]|jgi:CDGSH-type Zn-finger protein|nr:CDGSH iron-sulfur domain-containing protein [Desulfitobacteriaceae bacterium]
MEKTGQTPKISIVNDGPYIVTGGVPLAEIIIVPKGKGYELKAGRALPQSEQYTLCRCGNSKNAPFCDGSHIETGFIGTELASRTNYEDRAKLQVGSTVDLLDDYRCAFVRLCHRENGDAWELTRNSDNEDNRKEAIQAASDCPAGRLVAVDKNGKRIEPVYEPAIEIIQDPERGVSAGIFVKGKIPLESAEGFTYEVRNRYVLCRCGESINKPFCDTRHVRTGFTDKLGE